MYSWSPNGAGRGFTQKLMCRFEGSEPHFNHIMRFMNRPVELKCVILLPRGKMPCLVIGNSDGEIEIAIMQENERQVFVMECAYNYYPLPYYDGPLNIEDCTVQELMKAIW